MNVTEPPALSAFIDIDTDDRRASMMSGSSRYNIEINGKKTTVGSDSFRRHYLQDSILLRCILI